MNDIFFPTIILTYLDAFRQVFSKPNYDYFKSFIWALLLVKGRKCITNIHNACFFLGKHFSSFERFFSQNKWDINDVIKTTVENLISYLKDKLLIHGGFLAVIDTTKKAKSGKGRIIWIYISCPKKNMKIYNITDIIPKTIIILPNNGLPFLSNKYDTKVINP